MKNILIFSDLHITQSALKESVLILEEIGALAKEHNVDTLINLGDTFDCLKPSSNELDVFSTFLRRLNRKMIIIAADSHESTTQEESILNHFGILNEMVTVVKEFKDSNHLYCGHFILSESSKGFGSKLSKTAFKDYLYVFLGHQHSYELIKPNCVQLGSCRYVNFDEAKDKEKIVALITNYGTQEEKVHFLKLKQPISMKTLELSSKEVVNTPLETLESTNSMEIRDTSIDTQNAKSSISQAQTPSKNNTFSSIQAIIVYLDKLDAKTKVKIKILDFEAFRQFLPFVDKYVNKFEVLRYVTEFEIKTIVDKKVQTETVSFKEAFKSWLEKQEVDNSIKSILLKEIE